MWILLKSKKRFKEKKREKKIQDFLIINSLEKKKDTTPLGFKQTQ